MKTNITLYSQRLENFIDGLNQNWIRITNDDLSHDSNTKDCQYTILSRIIMQYSNFCAISLL